MALTFVSKRCNTSIATTDTTSKLASPDVKIAEIMILVFFMTYLLVFLAVFGTWRRSSRSLFWKVMIWLSYVSSVALSPFILGMIQQAPFKDELLIIWGMLLLIVYALPDSFSAYSPEDVSQWRMNYVQILLKFSALAILWAKMYLDFEKQASLSPMGLFTFIVLLKAMTRSLAQFFASPDYIEEKAKLSEVCMTYEHNLSNEGNSDPVSMEGYRYLVAIPGYHKLTLDDVLQVTPSDSSNLGSLLNKNGVVTLEKVWNYKGRLLMRSERDANKFKDICLSYFLLKILLLKSADYVLVADAQPKARKLITEGLLASEDKDRTFRVIEVELKLLYELVYTKYTLYASPISAGFRVVEFVLTLIVCALTANYVYRAAECLGIIRAVQVNGFTLDVLVTFVLLSMIGFADMAQVWMVFSSEWVKAALLYNYVANRSCLNNRFAETIIRMVCDPVIWKPWSRRLGQYSLIESPSYGTWTMLLHTANAIFPGIKRDGQKERKSVHLSEEVKCAVLDCLRTKRPHLEIGMSYMRSNDKYGQFLGEWNCEHEAEVILVWHIATTYCKIKSRDWDDGSSAWSLANKNCMITSDLSNYLAYLIAFAPRLLPPPHFEPQFQFRRVMKEAREVFADRKKEKDKIEKLDTLSQSEDKTIIGRGARLGKELLGKGVGRWEILSAFWSDMALCAATSGEMRAHLEKLADGGEFITHLWALLHHTCISPSARRCKEDDRPSRTQGV